MIDRKNTSIARIVGIAALALLVGSAISAEITPNRGDFFTKTVGTTPGVCAEDSDITVGPGTTVYYCYAADLAGANVSVGYNITDDILGPIGTGTVGLNETLELIVSSFIESNVTNIADAFFYESGNMSNNGTTNATAMVAVDPDLPGDGNYYSPEIPTLSEIALFSFGFLLIAGALFTIRRAS